MSEKMRHLLNFQTIFWGFFQTAQKIIRKSQFNAGVYKRIHYLYPIINRFHTYNIYR